MIYPILAYGTPVLKQRARDIEKGEIDLDKFIDDMYETLHHAEGIGLAAPQVGFGYRIFIVDGRPLEETQDFVEVFINPVIIEEFDEEWIFQEGCLSIPGIREDVSRPGSLRIKWLNKDWEEQEATFDGMKARIIQHEYDHIEGILFTDHLSPLKKKLLKSKLNNISKGIAKVNYAMQFPLKK